MEIASLASADLGVPRIQRTGGQAAGDFDKALTSAMEGQPDQGEEGPVLLGTLSRQTPTVSDLLAGHPKYSDKIWKIVHSDINRNLPYHRMALGSRVYVDPNDHRLTCEKEGSQRGGPPGRMGQEGSRDDALGPREGEATVRLGSLSRDCPTVSDLLERHKAYAKEVWEIVHGKENRDKPFHRIAQGAEVFLNPATREVTWENTPQERLPERVAPPQETREELVQDRKPEKGDLSDSLVGALRPYLGKPYDKVDCYELVVAGLKRLGVRYEGQGGLAEKLMRMAGDRGLSDYACFTGEGLLEASGYQVFGKEIHPGKDFGGEAVKTYEEMEPFLKKGFLLSFSTPSRGHTGVVSKSRDAWTYINSGVLDNRIGGPARRKGVGEETLIDEVRNWFRFAASQREPLRITVGGLHRQASDPTRL